ncbi:YbjN domain-containing protein [Tomitella fengzijianii]|uniref:YbjN domain-containing protein n=1 Tax=Tomitella fengzijianii TaxID=2597660 RepID=A0A516X5D2_9ACTN|nr:YbjN domain-containing protein [Tomitella fengzijianii]QDQ98264.1 YbjN domain-containing protein [Tomitella fengzijianii]
MSRHGIDGAAGAGEDGSGSGSGDGVGVGVGVGRRSVADAVALIGGALDAAGIEYTRPEGPHFVLTLPGERKLKTTCLLTVGMHGVRVEAFVARHPDEDHAAVYKWLLRRNRHLFGVHYTIDKIGDVYLVGRISMDALGSDELDRVLGQVLEAADGDFNTILELGFHTSIRREWRWRTVRGESLRNLAAFEHLVTDEDRAAAARGEIGRAGDPPRSVVTDAGAGPDAVPGQALG